jgi:phage terminase small subunit
VKPLNPKQHAFVDQYMVDLNATQAAIRAGYSAKTAYAQGHRLLKHVEVAAAVTARRKELADKMKLDREWCLRALKNNHDRAMQAEPVLDSDGCPTGIFKYEGAVANKSIELIGKFTGELADKVVHGGDPKNPIKTESAVTIYLPDNGRSAQADKE